jgi:LacI family transcriptional regulator
LTDVAALAGVSVATASKAMNGRSQVAAATRQKVLEAAETLSFTPNPFAQALNSIRTGTIGMLTTDLYSRFVLPVLRGAEDAFGAGSMTVLLCDARGDAIREQHHIKMLLGKRVDGLVVVGRTTNPRYSLTAGVPVPVVYVYEPSEDPSDLSLTPNNRQAGRLAAEHLISRGRQRIALVNGDPSFLAARDRATGVEEAMAAAGLELVSGNNLYGQWSEAWGRHCVDTLLDTAEEFDAVLCGSDQIARGVLDRLRERGLVVPRDVAVMGFDNWDEFGEVARPPLSSIDMNLARLGRTAAHELVRAIGGEHRSGIVHGDVRVVPRESTGAIRLP